MSAIPLFPLSRALFPGGVLHLRVFEIRYLDMVKRCLADGAEFGVVALLSGREVRTPEGTETLAGVGTMARIDDAHTSMPGLMQLRCTGTTRFVVQSCAQQKYGLWTAETQPLPDDPVLPIPPHLQPTADALGRLVADLQRDGVAAQDMPIGAPFRLDESGWVADRWCELLPIAASEQVELLGSNDPVLRLARVQQILIARGLDV